MRPKWSRSGKTSACSGRNAPPESTRYTRGQAVLLGDLLRAQVLLHRDREVGAALHGGVVGHHHHLAAADAADAGDDARRRAPPRRRGRARPGRRSPGRACRDRAAVSMRSRTRSFPCSRWRRIASSPPPARASARRARRSASSASMWARFSRNSADRVSTWLSMTGIGRSMPYRFRAPGEAPAVETTANARVVRNANHSSSGDLVDGGDRHAACYSRSEPCKRDVVLVVLHSRRTYARP